MSDWVLKSPVVTYRQIPCLPNCQMCMTGTSHVTVGYPIYGGDGAWYFTDLAGQFVGPYATFETAIEKYELYEAFVITAPTCHHPN